MDASINTLHQRLIANTSRPLLQGENKLQLMQKKFTERQEIYISTAHHIISIDGMQPELIAKRITQLMSTNK